MADSSRDHLERLIFEVHGAEKGAEMLEKLRQQEEKYATSLKGLKKQAQETAKAEEEASRRRQDAMEGLKGGALVLAAALAGVAKVGAEMVQTYARVDAANGRLKFALEQTGMAAHTVNVAMREAKEQFRAWEEFGVSSEKQAESFRALVTESGDYAQSLKDVKLAIDIHNASGWEMERATEAVRKARQGEVEVLKELGILTKDEAEDLGKVEDQAERTRKAIAKLDEAFGGGGKGTAGLEQSLAEANVKLEDTKRIMGELITVVGAEGTGLIGSLGEFLGVIDEGEHPLDALNKRLETLLQHAKDGDWEKLSGILLMVGGVASANPALIATGAAQLGVASTDVGSRTETAAGRAELLDEVKAAAGFRGTGNQVDEVPEPTADNMSGGPAKKPSGRRARADEGPSGFEGEFDQEFASLEEVRGAEAQALQEREDRRQLFIQRMSSLSDEERAQWEADQAQYIAHQKKMGEVAEGAAEQRIAAKEAELQAAMAGAQAAVGIADSLIENEGVRLAMQSVSTAAQAAVLFAKALAPPDPITGAGPQNLPGAIAMAGAAVELGIAAGMAGKGGGGKATSKKGGGGRGGSAPSLSSDRERVSLMSEQSRSREARAPQTHVVNIYSTFGPSPQQSRELVDAVEREMRNRTSMRRL